MKGIYFFNLALSLSLSNPQCASSYSPRLVERKKSLTGSYHVESIDSAKRFLQDTDLLGVGDLLDVGESTLFDTLSDIESNSTLPLNETNATVDTVDTVETIETNVTFETIETNETDVTSESNVTVEEKSESEEVVEGDSWSTNFDMKDFVSGLLTQTEVDTKPLFVAPSRSPSSQPSLIPSSMPSISSNPSLSPSTSTSPSSQPSLVPSSVPSQEPSISMAPSTTTSPSTAPSTLPTTSPSSVPSDSPSKAAIDVAAIEGKGDDKERSPGRRLGIPIGVSMLLLFVAGFVCFYDFAKEDDDFLEDGSFEGQLEP